MGSVTRAPLDQKLVLAKRRSHEGVVAGAKAAVLAIVATAVPTCENAVMGKTNLNPTAQALTISTAAEMTYFIVVDKTVLASARKNSFTATN